MSGSERLDHAERASTGFMFASGGVLHEGYVHVGSGVCLCDGQTEARGCTVARWTRRRAVPAYAPIPDLTCSLRPQASWIYVVPTGYKFKMAAPVVHVETEHSSDSEAIPDISDQNAASDKSSDEETPISSDGEPQLSSDADADAYKATGLGDVMSRILQKNPSGGCSVLAKGLTDRQIQKKRKLKAAEEDSKSIAKKVPRSDGDSSSDSEEETHTGKIEDPVRVKPNPLQRDIERKLQRIATKGVVQLFNAVQKQQKLVEGKLSVAGSSEVKKSKALKTVTKGGFLDMLKPLNKDNIDDSSVDKEPSWKILRDDYMMGAKLKDWDKESDGDKIDGVS